jgi:hypothetical protein
MRKRVDATARRYAGVGCDVLTLEGMSLLVWH